MRLVVTGGAGFIGANFVQHALREHPQWKLVVVDKLTYAGNLRNLEPVLGDARCEFVRLDICEPGVAEVLRHADAVIHFAAETHVDRSLENSAPFVRTNVEGTLNLLEAARQARVARFLHVGTDEVYGSIAFGRASEQARLAPTSPYAASKAAADLMVLAYVHSHGFPALITRCTNNYGPYQFPEKFIPLMIAQALDGQPLPLYGDGQQVRDWIHVSDHCRALDRLLSGGREGEIYNIGAESGLRNLEVAQRILRALERDENLLQFVSDRPAHDRRYALDCRKLKSELGWQPQVRFEDGLAQTIAWYREHATWLAETRSGEYREYFERHYTRREQTFAGKP